MADNKEKYTHLKALGHITQFGLDMVSPIVLSVILAASIKNVYGFGSWIVFVAIIIGVAASCLNMMKYMKAVNKEMEGKNDDKEHKD